ncbi:hypothetical protein [Sneathiella glossodoripedis]|uniref:hypothetical protein n=1 Tax=Sneathiella glossodoripedis TaxID=418853 RepID=UPI000470F395|nr:hypothetical protein [Sneathiella glossodoripedis]
MKKELIGKHLLVGLTYFDREGEITERLQLHGKITAVGEETVWFMREDNGEEFSIPFDEEAIHPAEPGEYQMKDSDEIVVDPDFVSTWSIQQGPDELNEV